MNIIDLHCDTAHKIFHLDEKSLYDNSYSVDIKKMSQGNVMAQFFALFLDKGWVEEQNMDIFEYALNFQEQFALAIDENDDYISLVRNYNDLIESSSNGKFSAFLTIEGGGFLKSKLERLDIFFDLGIRLITLTWNYENCIGYPNSKDASIMSRGLKKFGFETLERMNELGIIVDVSHLSDGGFYDCIKHSKKPIIASHSNARAITNVPRNLTDEMIKALADKGGVIGLNFCPHFLGNDGIARIEYMIQHLQHIKNTAGIDAMALGSDFDGIRGELEITNIGDIGKLVIAMQKSGFHYDEIEKICYKNALRIIRECTY